LLKKSSWKKATLSNYLKKWDEPEKEIKNNRQTKGERRDQKRGCRHFVKCVIDQKKEKHLRVEAAQKNRERRGKKKKTGIPEMR